MAPTLFIGQTEAGRAKKEAKPASRWAGPPLSLVSWKCVFDDSTEHFRPLSKWSVATKTLRNNTAKNFDNR